MAKRILLVSVLAALVAGGAFAQVKLSAGAGYIHGGGNLGAYTSSDSNYDYNNTPRTTGNGGFLFLDANYAELSLGFISDLLGTIYESKSASNGEINSVIMSADSLLSMDIGLLGRYPVPVGKMTISPLLGVGYNLVLSAKSLSGKDVDFDKENYLDGPRDYSTFRIRFGAGADFDITDHIFVRAQGLARYSFAPKSVTNLVDRSPVKIGAVDYKKLKGGGFGGEFTFAVGYRF